MSKITNTTKLLYTFLKLIVILYIVVSASAFFSYISPKANAYYTYKINGITSNSTLHCDNNGVYITSFSGSNLDVNYIINNTIDKRTLKITGEIKSVTTDNGIIYAISHSDNYVFLNRYVCNTDTLNSFIIREPKINLDYRFAISNDRLYFAENADYGNIACYSIYGEKLYSFYLDSVIDYRTGNNNTLYIFTKNQIYSLDTTDNYQPVCILNTVNIRSNVFFCGDTFFDYSGQVIIPTNNIAISTKIECSQINCAIVGEYYCKYYSNNIYGYSQENIQYTLYNINAGENAQMCSYQDKIYLLSENQELFIIEQSELNFPLIKNNSNNNNISDNHNNNNTLPTNPTAKPQSNNNSQNNNKKEFSINNYYIDTDKNIIWDIPSETTIAGLKNNLTYNGYELKFYDKNNVKKTAGNIGTGFTMVIESNNTEFDRYSISVKGDLSGEGNISKADVKILSEYFMNVSTLTDEQYTASDCNGDNIIDGVDILKIARNNL